MKIIAILASLFTSFCYFMNCSPKVVSTNQNTMQVPIETVLSYTRYKARCRKCPDFSIELLNTKMVNYVGKANMKVLGEQSFRIADSSYNNIKTALTASNFSTLDEAYLSRIRDLPVVEIVHKEKAVKFQDRACPDALKELVALIEKLPPVE